MDDQRGRAAGAAAAGGAVRHSPQDQPKPTSQPPYTHTAQPSVLHTKISMACVSLKKIVKKYINKTPSHSPKVRVCVGRPGHG